MSISCWCRPTRTGCARRWPASTGAMPAEINRREDWRGHLWQSRFASFPMEEAHLHACLRYVELNPVRAGLVDGRRTGAGRARARISAWARPPHRLAPMRERIDDWRAFSTLGLDDAEREAIRTAERTVPPASLGTLRRHARDSHADCPLAEHCPRAHGAGARSRRNPRRRGFRRGVRDRCRALPAPRARRAAPCSARRSILRRWPKAAAVSRSSVAAATPVGLRRRHDVDDRRHHLGRRHEGASGGPSSPARRATATGRAPPAGHRRRCPAPATIRSATSCWNIRVSDVHQGGQASPPSQRTSRAVPTL